MTKKYFKFVILNKLPNLELKIDLMNLILDEFKNNDKFLKEIILSKTERDIKDIAFSAIKNNKIILEILKKSQNHQIQKQAICFINETSLKKILKDVKTSNSIKKKIKERFKYLKERKANKRNFVFGKFARGVVHRCNDILDGKDKQ
jgi:F0F1-type ATP synthase alpha subunit